MKKALIVGLAVVLVSGGVLTMVTAAVMYRRAAETAEQQKPANGYKAVVVGKDDWKNVKWIKEFTLTERSGRPFDSHELDGQVWVVSFFFASCPATCKDQNAHIERLHRKFGPQGVKFVSITCDPASDTPERLREYAHLFNADPNNWLFLTGDLEHIQRIGAETFGVYVAKGVHLDRLTVVDKWGKVRGHFDWTDPGQLLQLQQTLDDLLTETTPPADGNPTG